MSAMTTDSWKATGRAVKAARIAAGVPTRDALAKLVKLPRFGAKTIGSVERGERQLFEHEAVELGRVLDVEPESFFPSDAPAAGQLDRIERQLAEAEEERAEMRALIDKQNELLARQSTILEHIEDLIAGIPSPEELAEEAEAIAQAKRAKPPRSARPRRAKGS